MFLKFALTVTLLNLFITSVSFADEMGPLGDKFYEEAAHFVHACKEDPCKAPYSQLVVYDQSISLNQLSSLQRLRLTKIAARQAQVWGDTILEGDYYAEGYTRLDKVLAFYKGSDLVGFKIQYSEKAWFIGECNFDDTKASLQSCQEGRIVEESYVSPEAKTYFSDEEHYAAFE